MVKKPTSGNRTEQRGHRTRQRHLLDKDAAKTLDTKAREWEIEADRLLSALILTASPEVWAAVREIIKEMGGADGAIPDNTGDPILL